MEPPLTHGPNRLPRLLSFSASPPPPQWWKELPLPAAPPAGSYRRYPPWLTLEPPQKTVPSYPSKEAGSPPLPRSIAATGKSMPQLPARTICPPKMMSQFLLQECWPLGLGCSNPRATLQPLAQERLTPLLPLEANKMS